ncbi:hypothetical protein HUU51_01445 [Candidatus Gracilibacteria bacterium]|nr:hypothetical protein [Candidatus Gracilibacteria bacterium]
MSESDSYLTKDEQEHLKKILKTFELETNYMDAIVFVKDGENYRIIFDYSLVSNSSEYLAYWFYHLDFRNIVNMKIGDIKGFVDVFKDKYDVIVRISQNVFIFVSKDKQENEEITQSEMLRLQILKSDLEETILSTYAGNKE